MLTVTVVEVCVASVCRIFPVFFLVFILREHGCSHYIPFAWIKRVRVHLYSKGQPTNTYTHRQTLASVLSTPIHMHTILHRFSSLSLQICSMCVYCIAFFVGHSFLAVSFSSFRSRHSREFSLPMFFLKFTRAVFLFQSFNCIALNEKCIDS